MNIKGYENILYMFTHRFAGNMKFFRYLPVFETPSNQLSHIPLFTPEQELEHAKHLETLELQTWRLVLAVGG